MEQNKEKVISVKDLAISFKTDHGIVHAVRGVSFDLYKGETLCIVGESGSGKSVTNKAIMGISANNAIIEGGSILFEGEDLLRVSEEEFHRIRGHKIGMIFQDPLSALNPVVRIGKQITEATLINKDILKKHYKELIANELVAFRNCEANFDFEENKIKDELAFNKKALKVFEKGKNEKNKALYDKFSQKLLKEMKDSKVQKKMELERLKEAIATNNEKVSSLEDNDSNKLKREISELSNEFINKEITLYEKEQFFDAKIENIKDYILYRNTFLGEVLRCKKALFKIVHPLLKNDLNNRKKIAKVENKRYADDLKTRHEEEIAKLNIELEDANNESQKIFDKLSESQKAEILKIRLHNDIAKKKLKKIIGKNVEHSISKTVKDDSLVILRTNIKEYDDSLDKIKKIEDEIEKANIRYINSTKITKAEAKRMALKVMKEVGIPLPERRFRQYPFEFSGGMRQRIVIAIALTANPEILICDEPTTALDVTIQAQILELINRLKNERNLSCIFITHDLGVVANMADRVAVMYAGKIVEYGLANEVFFNPKHPYTWALLSSIPDIDSKEKLDAIPGTPPDMVYPPKGDAFALRSKYAMAIDFKYQPPLFKVSDTHYAATWLLYPGAPKAEMPAIVKTRIKNALEEEKKRVGLEELKEEVTCYDQIK